jgi:hypothetical protein
MAAVPTHEPAETSSAAESPLLAVFAAAVIVGAAVISIMIAAPSTISMIAALVTVMGFAVGVTYLLARVIGED